MKPREAVGTMSDVDIRAFLELSSEYERRALRCLANADELANRDELDKAGEMLWGAVVSYLNAIAALMGGEPLRRHKEVSRAAREIAIARGNKEFLRAFRRAEALHVNFYHGFVDREGFIEYHRAVLEVVAALSDTLWKLREAVLKLFLKGGGL